MFTGDTVMPFGRYKSIKLHSIPPEYLLGLLNHRGNKSIPADLFKYIDDNMDKIKSCKKEKMMTLQNNLGSKCIRSGKVVFFTQKEAQKRLTEIALENPDQNIKPVSEYECSKCGYWHLTSSK